MPSPFTFASAAASSNGDPSANKRDAPGAGDWSRNRPNGATHTFRRPSANTTTTTTSQSRDPPPQSATTPSTAGPYIPPHLNSNHPSYRNGYSTETRYTKEQMLDIYQNLKDTAGLTSRLADSFVGTWDPIRDNNGSHQARADKDQYPGPDTCWDYGTLPLPLGMVDLTDDEKLDFTSSVNSTVKMVQTSKDGTGSTPLGTRKTSLGGYGALSGNASRPGTRRRDTSDSFTANGPLSPTESKSFFQQSNIATPPPHLQRRRTFKDDEPSPDQAEAAKEEPGESQPPFASLRRIGTAPVNPQNMSSVSPWSAGPTSSGFGNIGMGSFGSFNVSGAQESSEKRPGFGSARGGSRFKDLLAKTSTEDISNVGKEKAIFAGLEKLPEEDSDVQSRMRDMFKTRPNRSETNPYEDAPGRSTSAAMSASQEGGPPAHGVESFGFSAFSSARDFGSDGSANPNLARYSGHEPLSPANTNPYQSPQGPRHDEDDHTQNDLNLQQTVPFTANRRNPFDSEASSRAFGGLPSFGPWSSAGLGSGIPARDRNVSSSGFGDPIFSPLSDLQSPGAGLGGGFFGAGPFGSAGKSSRLGAMFPPAMQEQMRVDGRNDHQGPSFGSRPDSAHQDANARDLFEGNFTRTSGAFVGLDEATPRASEGAPGFGAPGQSGMQQPIGAPVNQRASTSSDPDQGQAGQDGQMPAAQQRQMVMPDRMRWIYRDPQGAIQGPWSGLEMHDWFKAGFFTAELLVKKVEDTEFEPLAQLVRRIGNSREPFLVPQIGVPHGPTSQPPTTSWPNPPPTGTQPGNAQPPFASAFPSFGTTLTAEQQNALERRKQEEQYLMARQKEHLAQQQVFMRQGGSSTHNTGLQHHSSTQSLHSQPSFGSIASPHPGPFLSPLPGQAPPHQSLNVGPTSSSNQPLFGREDEIHTFVDRLSFNQRMNLPPGAGPLGAPGEVAPGMGQMLSDRARIQQQQQQQSEMRSHQDAFLGPQGRNDRLEEFNELRGQAEVGLPGPDSILPQPIGAQRQQEESQHKQPAPIGHPGALQKSALLSEERATLTEQIQRQAEWQEQQPVVPPPVSISPLPAPAAQRNRQHVADSLVPEPRSETQTPIETPSSSLAPWAQQPAEVSKGPSLKEIQAAEAKNAAVQEAIAAEARRVQFEQERLAAASMPPPAPGLPATSTWGQGSSPGTPTGPATSVWAKPAAKPTSTASAKKTLAQIQKEEEARKQRQAAAAAAANAQAASPAGGMPGKRYAELASKAASIPSPTVPSFGSAWTTVGSSGKAKLPVPATVLATPHPGTINRSVSGVTTVSAAAGVPAVKKPSLPTAKSTAAAMTNVSEKNNGRAEEEFKKWLRGQLSKGLNAGISVDEFATTLVSLPAEVEIIADSVYAASQTLDGRRIAEEFVRRRKLADKGVVVGDVGGVVNGGSVGGGVGFGGMDVGGVKGGVGAGAGGGWSEVAKKGPEREKVGEGAAGRREEFKVVAGKKKGKR